MKIEFTQTLEDLTSFYQFHGWHSEDNKRYRIKARIIYGLILTFVASLFVFTGELKVNGKPVNTSSLYIYLFLTAIFILGLFLTRSFMLRYWAAVAKKMVKDKLNANLLKSITVDFQPDQISWQTNTSTGISQSSSIKKIREDLHYHYLYVSSQEAWIIPKHSLKDPEAVQEFQDILKGYATRLSV